MKNDARRFANSSHMDEQIKRYQALDDWFSSALGVNLGQALADKFIEIQDMLSGSILLQLGACGGVFPPSPTFTYKWVASPNLTPHTHLLTNMHHLPLERESVDCILAPFTMEAFFGDPNILDEMDRILTPMGTIVFFDINPFSFWGAWLRCSPKTCFGKDKSRGISLWSLKRAMVHRGYSTYYYSNFYHTPPINCQKIIKKMQFVNKIPPVCLPFPSGFTCYVVQKYQQKLLPLPKIALIPQLIVT